MSYDFDPVAETEALRERFSEPTEVELAMDAYLERDVMDNREEGDDR